MGFLGSWRRIVLNSKNAATNMIDAATVSKKIITQADSLKLNNITHLFSTKYFKNVDNKVFLGSLELNAFIKASRLGDYNNSFKMAFAGTNLLADVNVERALRKLLDETAATLPDRKILRNANAVSRGRKMFNVTDKINTVDELSQAVANNNQLRRTVDKLVSSVRRTKRLKFLGYTILFTVIGVTAYDIYKKCVEISTNGTGCFLYHTSGGEIKKCKISPYSCLHGNKGDLCTRLILTDEITRCTDCQQDSNSQKACIHCHHDDELNKNLDDNHVLRCESPDAVDVLLEGVHQTIDGITSTGSYVLSSLFHWFGLGLIIMVVIVVIILVLR